MREMSREEWIEFAGAGTRTGKLAINRASGAPHVTPIWFLLDPGADGVDHLLFTTGMNTVKGRALRADPRLAVCVDLAEPPYSYLMISAEAELRTDPQEMLDWSIRFGARYMGEQRAEEFGARNAVPTEYLVRARITSVIAHADITG